MKKIVLLLAVLMFTVACTEKIPAGYKGKRVTRSGLQDRLLLPGNHTCWGQDQIYMISGATMTKTEKLNILTKDKINISVDMKVRATPILNNKNFNYLLDKLGAKFENLGSSMFALNSNWLYKTYIAPDIRPIARAVINKYPINEVAENRDKISGEIVSSIKEQMSGLPISIDLIRVSNIDFPDIITSAKEAAMERKEQIEREKAEMAVELLKLENRKKLAEKEKIVRMKEAEAERIYNQIVGSSLTSNYLKLRQIENQTKLYNRVGSGDKVIFNAPNGAYFMGK